MAKKYGRTQGYVSAQMKKFIKSPKLIRDAIDSADQDRDKAMLVQRVIKDMMDQGTFIGSVNTVIEQV